MAARHSFKSKRIDRLRWHERVWVGLPFGLVLLGGAMGGACGGAATACNVRLMNGHRPVLQKYLLTGLISLAALLVYLALAAFFLSLATQ